MANQSYSVQMGTKTLRVDISEANNHDTNQSIIGYSVVFINESGSYQYNYQNHLDFWLGGQALVSSDNICSINLTKAGQSKVLTSGTWTVNHAADGTCSFAVYMRFRQTQVAGYDATIDTTHACTTIPRATIPQLPTSAPIGQAITIDLPRANSAWVHDITYDYGALTGQTAGLSPATGAGTGCTFTPPNILHGQIAGMSSRLCTITVTTRQGSTVIGTRTATITLTASAKPVISAVQLSEAGSVPASWGVWVRGHSRIRVQVSASAQYASAIMAVTVSFGGKTYAGTDVTTDPVQATGTMTVTVTDDRGLTQTHTQTVTVAAYQPPRIRRFAVHRCDAAGNVNGTGTHGKATIEYECSAVGQNAASWALKYAVQGGALTQTKSGTGLTKSGDEVTGDIFAVDHIYDVVLTVTDALGESTAMVTLASASCMAEFRGDGRGVSLGGYSQGEGLEIYYNRAMLGDYDMAAAMASIGKGLKNADLSGITSYPDGVGAYRVTNTLPAGMPTGANGYGCLFIVDGGTYRMHLYVDSAGVLYSARTTDSSMQPTKWTKYSGAEVAART